jgi:heme/copper-type cytochrome/quinol oxidase subunit 2
MNLLLNILNINLDAPNAWGIYFQDSATPQFEGLVELHDNIMYYLVIILFGVGWVLLSIIRNYVATKSPISHKYLNHGTRVPAQKYSKIQKKKAP